MQSDGLKYVCVCVCVSVCVSVCVAAAAVFNCSYLYLSDIVCPVYT